MKELTDARYMSIDRFRIEKGKVPKHSLFFITSGEMELSIAGKQERAGKNTLVSFPNDLPFERKILSHAEFYYFRYENPDRDDLPAGKLVIENPSRMLATAKLILALEKTGGHAALKNAFLADLFAQTEAEAFLSGIAQDQTVALVHAYMEEHLQEKLSLPMLAEQAHLSATGLIHRFKKQTGQTPMAYLTRLRLSKAESLLAETNQAVARIAAICGFECPYYFSNAFKAKHGLSPRDYRKKHSV